MKRKIQSVLSLALSAALLTGTCAFAAPVPRAANSSTYINSTYGTLYGSTYGTKNASLKEKTMGSSAKTTKAVPNLRAKLTVHYAKSGSTIGSGENTGWVSNSSAVYTYDYEMHHFKNSETGLSDGFMNTSIIGYGTADALTSTPYVVYTNYTN